MHSNNIQHIAVLGVVNNLQYMYNVYQELYVEMKNRNYFTISDLLTALQCYLLRYLDLEIWQFLCQQQNNVDNGIDYFTPLRMHMG